MNEKNFFFCSAISNFVSKLFIFLLLFGCMKVQIVASSSFPLTGCFLPLCLARFILWSYELNTNYVIKGFYSKFSFLFAKANSQPVSRYEKIIKKVHACLRVHVHTYTTCSCVNVHMHVSGCTLFEP